MVGKFNFIEFEKIKDDDKFSYLADYIQDFSFTDNKEEIENIGDSIMQIIDKGSKIEVDIIIQYMVILLGTWNDGFTDYYHSLYNYVCNRLNINPLTHFEKSHILIGMMINGFQDWYRYNKLQKIISSIKIKQ